MTYWPLTEAHQCHTSAALSRAYLEEPGHMSFQDQQVCEDILCILPGFLKDLSRE